jgi:hypothetical protein
MEGVKISLGDFTRSLSQEARARLSKLSNGTFAALRGYEVQNPVRRANLDQFLAWLEHPFEINITTANIFDFSLLSDEFGVLELSANCDISSVSTVSVSNFQNCNQQIEAISNRLVNLEERISTSLRELRTDCEAKLAEMKSE